VLACVTVAVDDDLLKVQHAVQQQLSAPYPADTFSYESTAAAQFTAESACTPIVAIGAIGRVVVNDAGTFTFVR